MGDIGVLQVTDYRDDWLTIFNEEEGNLRDVDGYSVQNDLRASRKASARVKRRSRKSLGSRAIRSRRELARRCHSQIISMILFTAKEPASAVSRPFARESASSMRSAQIVLDDKQRQLIEPGGVSGEI